MSSAISVHDLTFCYPDAEPDAEPLLRGLDLSLPYGQMVALAGPSGCGKSTLLYLLGLLLTPVSGEVRVEGRSAGGLPDAGRAILRAHVMGFVFQDAALDTTRTVLDNVVETAVYRAQPRAEAVARARLLLERFGVALRADARPGQISGGQASRIALARALLGEPRIVLADEPTGNLDAASGTTVLDALREAAGQGAAVVVATHDPAVWGACDEVVTLR